MTLPVDFSNTGEWLADNGPERDVVVSSRVRLARNVDGFNFIHQADQAERQQLVALAREHALSVSTGESRMSPHWIDLTQVDDLERNLLVERHLISKHLARGTGPRAVVVSPNESMSIMVNEEDHYRVQVVRSGLQLRAAYADINAVDDTLEQRLRFVFHRRFGYLTACPTNVGTGIRISVMLHLPALILTNEIQRVRQAARDMHLAVRGFYGEGSEALGDIYQISNQTTLGKTEDQLLDEFEKLVIPRVIDYEREARRMLLDQRPALLDDRCFRAYGILRSARLIKLDEAMRLLSHLRLGIEMNRIPTAPPAASVNRLLLQVQSAHLQALVGSRLNQAERAEARATLIRNSLG